jgi:hypothetical protein
MPENWENLSVAPWEQPQPLQDYWERKLQHARQVPPAGLLLGNNLGKNILDSGTKYL